MEKLPKGQAYGQWAAPKEDGSLLIWPDPAAIAHLARDNAARLGSTDHVHILGTALPELRRAARAFVGHEGDRPLIATGHQTELHHPGVWIKNAVICAAAAACGGSALHVAVDTDTPKHLKLRWPGFSAPITDDPRASGAPWSGLLDPPTPAHLDCLISAAEAAAADSRVGPLVGEVLRSCRAYLIDQRDAVAPLDLPSMTANAQHQLDWSLGLRYTAITLSGLLVAEQWARFALALMADAERFAEAYNAALRDYREEAGIDSPDRPMPDLAVEGDRIEVPFWLDAPSRGTRVRANVRKSGKGYMLSVGDDAIGFGFDSYARPQQLLKWLRHHDLRIAPRAVSLTLFLRLFVCDVFVHGIGGGHYDQVTDHLIRNYFRIEPPGFAVATATLYHPLCLGRERVCLPCLQQEGHRLAHRVLGDEKRAWLDRLASTTDPRQRRAVFEQMHEARRRAMASDAAYQEWQRRLAEARQRLGEEAELFDRELFYAIQPADRLAGMIQRVKDEFGVSP
jgi:hypothetical protein